MGEALRELNDYAERLAETALRALPNGGYSFHDQLDDDGAGNLDLTIAATT